METLKSETKKRVLPSWMTAQVAERRVVPSKTPKKRRMVEAAVAARRLEAKTVYCMNEAELVDVALGILIEGRTQKPWEEPAVADAEKTELCPTVSGSPHSSSCGNSEEEDSGNDRLALGLSPSQRLETSTSAYSRSPVQQEVEDVFKYVREIFFS
ncbi:cell cycle regulator of non-homologous end joining [Fukomys damarensis]|uniref:cell cycle regulator of non-homologous end joining n=1 Tax=Fukomys damarensis TaxID=885580 RepID=UPI00053F49DC|nr:cell cycle regulator of non-homologous end joining [Fukomys damarensis]XP_010614472.1 cell cycle regulator of non-homologous end joining [Fukomys damarensis]XP_010614473.1 cell cycle regulator of non-homologous end joining [Fukomys damarensis]XP_010614474.1 cell cycle regulator of non-homologous end joining [Fukomys damarensis]XP_033620422.1 cell cycle regulator of non-homologous end joining [Fukomys damarensis]